MPSQNRCLANLQNVRKISGPNRPAPHSMATGTVAAIDADGAIWVSLSKERRQPIQARTTVDIDPAVIGSDVLLFLGDESDGRPIILGIIRETCAPKSGKARADLHRDQVDEYYLDKEKVEIEARQEIVLRCGECSVTLRKDGKIIVKGVHVISRAKGVNKIRGAAVNIN